MRLKQGTLECCFNFIIEYDYSDEEKCSDQISISVCQAGNANLTLSKLLFLGMNV